jgi:hypothetical protein
VSDGEIHICLLEVHQFRISVSGYANGKVVGRVSNSRTNDLAFSPSHVAQTSQDLPAGNIIEERIPVTLGDLAHSIDDEPQQWCKRLREVNLAHLTAKSAR